MDAVGIVACAEAAAVQSGQQHLTVAHGAFHNGAAFAHGIVRDQALIALELVPADVALVMIFDQNIAFIDRATYATPHALAAVLDTYLARRAAEGVGTRVDRIGQDIVHGVVGRQPPDDAFGLGIVRLDRQLDAFVPEPDVYLARTMELGNFANTSFSASWTR